MLKVSQEPASHRVLKTKCPLSHIFPFSTLSTRDHVLGQVVISKNAIEWQEYV